MPFPLACSVAPSSVVAPLPRTVNSCAVSNSCNFGSEQFMTDAQARSTVWDSGSASYNDNVENTRCQQIHCTVYHVTALSSAGDLVRIYASFSFLNAIFKLIPFRVICKCNHINIINKGILTVN